LIAGAWHMRGHLGMAVETRCRRKTRGPRSAAMPYRRQSSRQRQKTAPSDQPDARTTKRSPEKRRARAYLRRRREAAEEIMKQAAGARARVGAEQHPCAAAFVDIL